MKAFVAERESERIGSVGEGGWVACDGEHGSCMERMEPARPFACRWSARGSLFLTNVRLVVLADKPDPSGGIRRRRIRVKALLGRTHQG